VEYAKEMKGVGGEKIFEKRILFDNNDRGVV
jgi:hypothetical protein